MKLTPVVLSLALLASACGGGGSSSVTDSGAGSSGGVTVSNSPVTGPISSEPWNGEWQMQSAGGVNVVSKDIRMTLSGPTVSLPNGMLLNSRIVQLKYLSCILKFYDMIITSDWQPDTDTSQASVWWNYTGEPEVSGCTCHGSVYVTMEGHFPVSGGMTVNVDRGFSSASCAGGMFSDGFESGDVSSWSKVIY